MRLSTRPSRFKWLRRRRQRAIALVGAGLFLLMSNVSHASDEFAISNVWARESPPTVSNGAVYLVIKDLSGNGDRLIGVSTDIAARAELHEHRMEATHDSESDDQPEKKDHDKDGHGGHRHDGQSGSKHGMMKMRQVEAIEVPTNGTVELRPLGYHVMLFDLKAPLKDGERFDLTLEFEKAGATVVSVDVRKPGS